MAERVSAWECLCGEYCAYGEDCVCGMTWSQVYEDERIAA